MKERPKSETASELEKSRTVENLRRAFSEEAALAVRALYYATLAEYEGLEREAGVFKRIGESGATTVPGFLDFLKRVTDPETGLSIGGTLKNVEALLQHVSKQQDRDYPEMARVAREEGFPDIASWFETLAKAKRAQARKLKNVSNG